MADLYQEFNQILQRQTPEIRQSYDDDLDESEDDTPLDQRIESLIFSSENPEDLRMSQADKDSLRNLSVRYQTSFIPAPNINPAVEFNEILENQVFDVRESFNDSLEDFEAGRGRLATTKEKVKILTDTALTPGDGLVSDYDLRRLGVIDNQVSVKLVNPTPQAAARIASEVAKVDLQFNSLLRMIKPKNKQAFYSEVSKTETSPSLEKKVEILKNILVYDSSESRNVSTLDLMEEGVDSAMDDNPKRTKVLNEIIDTQDFNLTQRYREGVWAFKSEHNRAPYLSERINILLIAEMDSEVKISEDGKSRLRHLI